MSLEVDGITSTFDVASGVRGRSYSGCDGGLDVSSNGPALGWLSLCGCGNLKSMKKQASDQQFHDRRYQERKRAEAAKKTIPKKANEAKTGHDIAPKEKPEDEGKQ